MHAINKANFVKKILHMKKNLLILLLCYSKCYAQNYEPTTSQVAFKAKMLGITVEGNFKGVKTNLIFQNNEPVQLSATVDANTVNTANSLRDKHLKEKEDFFQPNIYPRLSMGSVSIQKVAENKYIGVFKLTIKTVTKQIKIPFNFTAENTKAILKTNFEINRDDWNIGGNTMGMSKNVKIEIILNLIKT